VKRSPPPARRTPLERGAPLVAGARIGHAEPDPDWPAARAVALRRDRSCRRCAHPTATDVHHRIARGMGGTSDPERHHITRLVSLCRSCHRWVHDHPTDATREGWTVRRGGDCAVIPIRTEAGVLRLTGDGAATLRAA
jgi:5-methylcytosine-specific restriction protein A